MALPKNKAPQNRNQLLAAALIVYGIVTFMTMLQHAPWRDETELWLIARDTTLPGLFAEMPYEAHPALWYLILRPFARLGLPYVCHGIIHWAVAVAIVAIFLWRAPLPLLTRILAVFSYYLFYQYCIEARVYAIGLLLLFLLALAYRSRFTNPVRYGVLLFFLFNSNVMMFPAAGILLVLWVGESIKEGRRDARLFASASGVVIGAILAAWQVGLIGKPADAALAKHPGVWLNTDEMLKALAGMFFVGSSPAAFLAAPAAFILLALLYAMATRPRSLVFCLGHVSALFLLVGLRMDSSPRHWGVLFIGVLFALWIAHYEEDWTAPRWTRFLPDFKTRLRPGMLLLNLSLVASTGYGWLMHDLEWNYDYSGSRNMAEYIQRNGLDKYPIAAQQYAHLSAIAVYFPGKTFWYAGIRKPVTFVRANREHLEGHLIPYEEALARMNEAFPPPQPLLILLNVPLDPAAFPRYQLLHKVDSTVFGSDERFYLYQRIAPGG